jgi:predicted house-cleaning NTP pyrophosphatase (Maf/HAM1 superfamily)
MDNTSVKMKKLSASSADEGKAAISKTDAQTRIEKISAQSTEVMSGLVVISTSKRPIGKGGEVQVTMGWSSKTRAAAEAIRSGSSILGAATVQEKSGSKKIGTQTDHNGPENKKSKTDF